MENLIIAGILILIVVFSVFRAAKHFRGGGCCSGGSNTIRDRKSLSAPKLGEKTLFISGMHCVNCEIRVENALNRLEHAACHVSFRKGTAKVSYSAEIADSLLRETVEKMGYRVTEIR